MVGRFGSKPNRYVINFSHHALDHYAVSCLSMRGPRTSLLERLKDREFLLVVRPSVGLHFQHFLRAPKFVPSSGTLPLRC